MYDVVQVHAEMGATGNASSPHPAVNIHSYLLPHYCSSKSPSTALWQITSVINIPMVRKMIQVRNPNYFIRSALLLEIVPLYQ